MLECSLPISYVLNILVTKMTDYSLIYFGAQHCPSTWTWMVLRKKTNQRPICHAFQFSKLSASLHYNCIGMECTHGFLNLANCIHTGTGKKLILSFVSNWLFCNWAQAKVAIGGRQKVYYIFLKYFLNLNMIFQKKNLGKPIHWRGRGGNPLNNWY